jgi:SAM-dependent methyltransferase
VKSTIQTETIDPNTTAVGLCPVCGCDHCVEWSRAPDRFHGRDKSYSLIRCPSCSLVRLQDPPPPPEMGQHYGANYDSAISGPGDDPAHWRERRESLLRFKSGGTLLDLGCSSGGFLTAMKGASWQLFGVEMSEQVARRARDRCGAEVFVGDILDAPFPPGAFDAITCFHVFEHLYQPREVLAKIAAWLKPEGVFYTMMPNIDSAGARIFGSYWYALELPRHLYHFSPASLRALATTAGLEIVSLTTNREMFIEQSMRYVFEEICRKAGYTRLPLAQSPAPGIPWRAIRKVFRLTLLPALTGLASLAGDGESIHAVFEKVSPGSNHVAGKGRLSRTRRFC